MFSDYQVVSLKNTKPFRDLHTRRCLALRFWEVVWGVVHGETEKLKVGVWGQTTVRLISLN